MSGIIGALIGLIGGLVAALVVAKQQSASTRALIAAEFEKLVRQYDLQAKAQARTRRDDWLLQTVPALLAASDPELHVDFNYAEVVSLIHKLQVILIPKNPLENAVNLAAGDLGLVVREALYGRVDKSLLLRSQDALTVATRTLLDES